MPETEAPRWALCSDCRIVGARTCLDVSPCWAPMRTEDLPADDPNAQQGSNAGRCLSRSPLSGVRCGLSRSDAHLKGHEHRRSNGNTISWATQATPEPAKHARPSEIA